MKNVMRYIMLALAIAALLLSVGCTGARVVVMPDSKSIEPPTAKGCGKVAVTEISGEDKSKVPSDLVIAFAKYLEQSGLFEEVYCPVRSSDKFDTLIEAKFDIQSDSHPASNIAKAFITGLTWFIIEPIIWYEHSFEFSGHLNIIKDGNIISTSDAKTKADLHRKLLSTTSSDAFLKELWPNSLKSLFSQLQSDVNTYCKQKPVETNTMTKRSSAAIVNERVENKAQRTRVSPAR